MAGGTFEMIGRSECKCLCHTDANILGLINVSLHVMPCCESDIGKQMTEDRPTLIYYVQTVLNTFKRDQEAEYSRDREYAIELLEKAMECQNDIWNAAIEAAANKVESAGNILLAHSVRELKK